MRPERESETSKKIFLPTAPMEETEPPVSLADATGAWALICEAYAGKEVRSFARKPAINTTIAMMASLQLIKWSREFG
jgi:hypothetical protein